MILRSQYFAKRVNGLESRPPPWLIFFFPIESPSLADYPRQAISCCSLRNVCFIARQANSLDHELRCVKLL